MASGKSLLCGDCGARLRSTEEAQAHAEAFGHINFSESTEAVLTLVCKECGKPCRTVEEQNLHTTRTGHAEFVDKTEEMAKPVVLEPTEAKQESQGGQSSEAVKDEMVVPAVNEQLKSELEAMGFSAARATRALYFCGTESVEAAINWIVEHENDANIDEMPMVPKGGEEKKPALTPAEARAKAQELVEKARKVKEAEEKRMALEREKERIRMGKEILEAKRIEEQEERKRILAFRKAEKEEEKRARDKIRLKLLEDKAERRRKLGLPPEDPAELEKEAAAAAAADKEREAKKMSSLNVRPASMADKMRETLRSLKHAHKEDDARVKRAFQTLSTYIGNVAKSPDEEKFRKVRLTNAAFQERVGSLVGGIPFLELCGFERDGEEYLSLPRDKVDTVLLNTAGAELNSAISNPFFGVL